MAGQIGVGNPAKHHGPRPGWHFSFVLRHRIETRRRHVESFELPAIPSAWVQQQGGRPAPSTFRRQYPDTISWIAAGTAGVVQT